MIYYLFDASALICRYLREYSVVLNKIHIQKISGKAFFYFPNICVAEVFNTFARKHYRDGVFSEKQYKDLCNVFRGNIKNGAFLYPYNLYRYHNYNADSIYEVEHKTQPLKPDAKNPKGKCSLSAFDILIIAMGMELQKIHPKDSVYILTNDERLAKVSNSKPGMFPKAIYLDQAKEADVPVAI